MALWVQGKGKTKKKKQKKNKKKMKNKTRKMRQSRKKEEKDQTPSVRLRPISTSANSIQVSWPKSNWPEVEWAEVEDLHHSPPPSLTRSSLQHFFWSFGEGSWWGGLRRGLPLETLLTLPSSFPVLMKTMHWVSPKLSDLQMNETSNCPFDRLECCAHSSLSLSLSLFRLLHMFPSSQWWSQNLQCFPRNRRNASAIGSRTSLISSNPAGRFQKSLRILPLLR